MMIPNSTLHRAALAASEAETENIIERCDCATCMEQRVAGLRSALPILRAAIRAELVEEIMADLDAERIVVTWPKGNMTDFPRSMIQCETMKNVLRTYLPESETTNDES